MKIVLIFILSCFVFSIQAQNLQEDLPTVSKIDLDALTKGKIHKFWLQLGEDAFNAPIRIPVMVAKGFDDGPVLGLTAALHGNELNGIPIINEVFDALDVLTLKGAVIAVPGLNPLGVFNDQRRFIDKEDLNRIFPGKAKGNRSQRMAYQIDQKVISLFDFHIDMHTASFGRVNSMYVRADIENDTLAAMAKLQEADILLGNKGTPSSGAKAAVTMRATAIARGIHSITVEYGNPQIYQKEMITRGKNGIQNVLMWLGMIAGQVEILIPKVVCTKSYWLYVDRGGLLQIPVELNDKIITGQLIGVLKTPFGDVVKEYFAPEDGVVIGKSTNPVNISGGRIIHLGILKTSE